MMKFLCLLFALAATANAGQRRTFDVSDIGVIKGHSNYNALEIKEGESSTEFTWKDPVNQDINPLRAVVDVRYADNRKHRLNIEIPNLCGDIKEGTKEKNAQVLILKLLTNSDKCPIHKGTKSSTSSLKSTKYISTVPWCGNAVSDIKVYKKSDTSNVHPILTARIEGVVKGC